jgi:AP-1 complex subunit gamma-1
VIAKECASIRTAIKDEENPYRHRNVAKLLFVHMLGYPTHFGQMECLKLIASHKFPEKRIGYLGLMLLLDEETEVLMLVTNSLKNDLNHANQFIVGQGLCALGDIGSPDMCRDLASEVEKLLSSNNQYIRKKACLALLRIVRKCPDFLEHYLDRIPSLLSDRSHGVLVGTLAFMIEISEASPSVVAHLRRHTQQLVRMLKNLVLSGYAPEHDVSGLTDPFLQASLPSYFPIEADRSRSWHFLGKSYARACDVASPLRD